MILRSTIFKAMGGDTIQALQTAGGLDQFGFSVDIRRTDEAIDYSHYQLLHFFNVTRPADIMYHTRKAGLPFVVSTILINYSEYDKYYRKGIAGMILRHFNSDKIEYLKAIARWIKGKDKMMSWDYLWKGHRNSVIEILKKAEMVLPNSVSEYGRVNKFYGEKKLNYTVVPNGVDTRLFNYKKSERKDPDLIICVARIEGIKNQLNLIKALNNTSYRLIIIGAPAMNQTSYFRDCRAIAADNIFFAGHLSQEKLVSYYQKAKVHVLPSWFETTGLSSLEAAAMGCSIVITDKGDAKEYFGEHAVYCDPSSPESIYAAVEKAVAKPFDNILQTMITDHYSWQQASLNTAVGYKKIVSKSWD